MNQSEINGISYFSSTDISEERIKLLDPHQTINSAPTITIFISAFNEATYIVDTIKSVIFAINFAKISYEILIIDDASSDETVPNILHFISENENVPIILKINALNRGLAANFVDAARAGQGQYFRMVCGDNVEPRSTLVTLFQKIGQADLIIPYHQNLKGKRKSRRLISNLYVFLCNQLSGLRLKYYNGLAILKRSDVLYYPPTTSGFGFQAELICNLLLRGRSYIEVPVSAEEFKPSTALTFRNFLSTIHIFLNILIVRTSHFIYKRDA